MTKYIIKKCPFLSTTEYPNGDIETDLCGCAILVEYCQDNDNCLLKQIAEECREEIKPICQIPDGCCGMKNIYSDSKEFAEKLLSYLEMEEVYEESESEEE